MEPDVDRVLLAMGGQVLMYSLRALAAVAEVQAEAEGRIGPRTLPLPPLFGGC